jgi:hypothetical protein
MYCCSDSETVGSNPTLGMDMMSALSLLCVPVQAEALHKPSSVLGALRVSKADRKFDKIFSRNVKAQRKSYLIRNSKPSSGDGELK